MAEGHEDPQWSPDLVEKLKVENAPKLYEQKPQSAGAYVTYTEAAKKSKGKA